MPTGLISKGVNETVLHPSLTTFYTPPKITLTRAVKIEKRREVGYAINRSIRNSHAKTKVLILEISHSFSYWFCYAFAQHVLKPLLLFASSLHYVFVFAFFSYAISSLFSH